MRLWAEFEKGPRLRHIGHLDLMRAMQRALRRSGTPVDYSKGYNPHILLSFASALSVGASGEHELMEVTLLEDESPEVFQQQMNQALPEDLMIRNSGILPEGSAPLMARVVAAQWSIYIFDQAQRTKLLQVIPEWEHQEWIPGFRKTKSGMKECNLKPLILDLSILQDETISMILSQEEGSTCKPSMVLESLKEACDLEEMPRMEIRRNHLLTRNSLHELIPLELTL